ncbi:MAG: hypothetical protein AABX13_05320 [Nanoarchaeota archaeon]
MKKEHWFFRVLPLLLVLAIALSVLNIYFLQLRKVKAVEAEKIIEEELRPAVLEVVKITLSNCDFCFDVEAAVEELKKQNVNITKEEALDSESPVARQLIEKYGIEKLPTYIASGEVNKSALASYFTNKGTTENERFIFTAQKAPYYDAIQKKIAGLVTILNLKDSSCSKCTDLTPLVKGFEDAGVLVTQKKTVEYTSPEGQRMIALIGIKEIPALVISREIESYPEVLQQLQEAGVEEKEGFYAVHPLVPPYRDLAQGKVVGLVKVIYLADESCTECYDVTLNRRILQQFGLVMEEQKTVDVKSPEGLQLTAQYNIIKVPIIVLSPEAGAYANLVQAWNSVGTVEEDGWYVMRSPEVLGTYKDLATGETVKAEN